MTTFTDILNPEYIRQGIVCSSKKRLFEAIAHTIMLQIERTFTAEEIQSINELTCFESLFEREKLGSTFLGNGIAIPRARLPIQGSKPFATFFQLSTPIEYDSTDKVVDLVLALFIPENICDSYCTHLQNLTTILSEKNLYKSLRSAQSTQEIWEIFETTDNLIQDNELIHSSEELN